jgi:RNA polymerase sigma-70 factor (ECF subfamily)
VKKKETQNVSLDAEDTFTEIASEGTPLGDVMQKEQKMELFAKMQTLSPQDREVVYLRTFADLSFKEIGEVLDDTDDAIRQY